MGKLDRKELRRMWADSGDLKLTNPVMENILARRSIRKFTDQPVPRRLVETLVKAGINAPSGHNLQTWRFTVLTNQAEIQRLKAVIQPVSKRCKTIRYGFNNPQALILISNDRRNATASRMPPAPRRTFSWPPPPSGWGPPGSTP